MYYIIYYISYFMHYASYIIYYISYITYNILHLATINYFLHIVHDTKYIKYQSIKKNLTRKSNFQKKICIHLIWFTELLKFISLNKVPNTTQSPSSLSLPSLSIIRDKIGTDEPHLRADKILKIKKLKKIKN